MKAKNIKLILALTFITLFLSGVSIFAAIYQTAGYFSDTFNDGNNIGALSNAEVKNGKIVFPTTTSVSVRKLDTDSDFTINLESKQNVNIKDGNLSMNLEQYDVNVESPTPAGPIMGHTAANGILANSYSYRFNESWGFFTAGGLDRNGYKPFNGSWLLLWDARKTGATPTLQYRVFPQYPIYETVTHYGNFTNTFGGTGLEGGVQKIVPFRKGNNNGETYYYNFIFGGVNDSGQIKDTYSEELSGWYYPLYEHAMLFKKTCNEYSSSIQSYGLSSALQSRGYYKDPLGDSNPLGNQSRFTGQNIYYLFGGHDGTNLSNKMYIVTTNCLNSQDNPSIPAVIAVSEVPSTLSARYFHSAVWAGNPDPIYNPAASYISDPNAMLVFGGYDGSSYLNDMWQYSATFGWTEIYNNNPAATNRPKPRFGHKAVWASGKMYVFGGYNSQIFPGYNDIAGYEGYFNDLWVYDPSIVDENLRWQKIDLQGNVAPRAFHSLNFSTNVPGQAYFYVVGGYNGQMPAHPIHQNLSTFYSAAQKGKILDNATLLYKKLSNLNGSYCTKRFDFDQKITIKQLQWKQTLPANTTVTIEVYTDNGTARFSDLSVANGTVTVPITNMVDVTYFRIAVMLGSNDGSATPTLDWVEADYVPSQATAISNEIIPEWRDAGTKRWDKLKFKGHLDDGDAIQVSVLDKNGNLTTPSYSEKISGITGDVSGEVDLRNLDAVAYPSLKLKLSLIRGSEGNNPSLDDWSISWAQADAGEDRTVAANSTVNFDGSQSIGDAVTCGGEDLKYRWSFGDGAMTSWSTSALADHIFGSVGPRTVLLEISRDETNILSTDMATIEVIANFVFSSKGDNINVARGEQAIISTFETHATGIEKWSQLRIPVQENIQYLQSIDILNNAGSLVGSSSQINSGDTYVTINVSPQMLNTNTIYKIRATVKNDAVPEQTITFGTIGPDEITSDISPECVLKNTRYFLSNINVVKTNPQITIEATAMDGETVYMDDVPPVMPLLKFWGKTSGPSASMGNITINPYDMNINLNNVARIEIIEMDPGVNNTDSFIYNYTHNNPVKVGESAAFTGSDSITIPLSNVILQGSRIKDYFVVAVISTSATPGERVGVSLNPSSGVWGDTFLFEDGTIITPSEGQRLPEKSVKIDIHNINVSVSPSDIAITPVYQGTNDLGVFEFTIKTLQGNDNWKNLLLKSLNVTKNGTPKIDRVKLYYVPQTGEIPVGEAVFSGSTATVYTNFSSIPEGSPVYPYINTTEKKFRIKADINPDAVGKISFTVQAGTFAYVKGGDTNVSTVFNPPSNTLTTKDIDILMAVNTISIDGIDDAMPQEITQASEMVIMGIKLSKGDPNIGAASLRSLTIRANGSTFDTADVSFKLYRVDSPDIYNTRTIDEDHCLLLSQEENHFSSLTNPLRILLSTNELIDGQKYYFLTAKVSSKAKFESEPENILSKIKVNLLSAADAFEISTGDNLDPKVTFPVNLTETKITDQPDEMRVVPSKVSPLDFEARQGELFPIAKLNNYMIEDYALWKGIMLEKWGSLENGYITSAALYLDSNSNGEFDKDVDQIVTEPTPYPFESGYTGTVSFVNFEKITELSENRTYFVVLGIADTQNAVSKTIGISISNNQGISLLGVDSWALFNKETEENYTTPFQSEMFTIIDKYVPTRPRIVNLDYDHYSANFLKVNFRWESTAYNGISETRYYFSSVPVDPSSITNWVRVTTPPSEITFDCNPFLEQDKTYYLYVETVSRAGADEYVSPVSREHSIKVDTTAPSRLARPIISSGASDFSQNTSNSVITNGSYIIHWYPSYDHETPIINYEVQERDNENAAWRTLVIDDPANINFNTESGTFTKNIVKADSFKTYYYKVRAQNAAGLWSDWSEESVNVVVGQVSSVIAGEPTNYPNPFDSRNGSTKINFSVGAIGNYDGDIKIFDMYGRLVKKIDFDGVGPITKEIEWNGENGAGAKVSKGVYIAVITVNADSGKSEKKIRKVGVIH